MTRERKKSTLAVIAIIVLLLIAGYIEVEAKEDKKSDSRVIVVPNTNSKQIIVMEDKTSTTIMDLTNRTIKFCSSTDGSLIICQDLSVGRK